MVGLSVLLLLSLLPLTHAQTNRPSGTVVSWGHQNVPYVEPGTRFTASNGSVIAWGDNRFGQTTVPLGLPPAFAIVAGWRYTVALVRDPLPSLTLLRNADQTLSLSWRGIGALEQTESLTAPNWQPAPSQANPQILSAADAAKFFRVKAE